MMIFAPIDWDPETSGSVLWRHPPGCIRCLPAPRHDPNVPEILWVIYWTVAGRDPTTDECEANTTEPGDVRELFALLDRVARRTVDLALHASSEEHGVLFITYATTDGWHLRVTHWWDPRGGPHGCWERHLSAAVNPRGERVALVAGVEQRWGEVRDRFPASFMRA